MPSQNFPSQPQGSSKQTLEQKTNQATQRVADKAQSSFENARNSVSQQMSSVAQAMSSAADRLKEQDQTGLSERVQQYVQKAENASQYLKDKSPRELKQDLEQLARDKPAWFLGGAFLVGVLGARFLKSSEKNVDQSMKGSVEYARA